MKKKNDRIQHSINRLRAKLSFDDGFAERPLYTIKAFTNEKSKGINMLSLIEDNFSITLEDRLEHEKKEWEDLSKDINEFSREVDKRKKVEWTKDEKGRIISPFSKKKIDEVSKNI